MTKNSAILFWTTGLLAWLPSLIHHLQRTWQLEQYHYLPALALAFGFLVANRWDKIWKMPTTRFAWLLIAMAGFLFVAGLAIGSSWTSVAGLVCFIGSWLFSHYEANGKDGRTRSLATLWPLLFLVLPLPLSLDTSLTQWLQFRSSELSSYSLDLFRIPHALFGNVIELKDSKLFVEQACSGVQSLFTVIFISLLVVVGFRRSPFLIPFYLLAAILWAGFMNVVRIVTIAIAQEWYAFDLSHGMPHDVLGYICLALACLLLLSTDRLLRVLSYPVASGLASGEEPNPMVYRWNRIFQQSAAMETRSRGSKVKPSTVPWLKTLATSEWIPRIIAGLACVLLLTSGYRFFKPQGGDSVAAAPIAPFSVILPDELPTIVESGFALQGHSQQKGNRDQPFGENADVWRGSLEGVPVAIVFSQPYGEWHDLCVCQNAIGCETNFREVRAAEESGKAWNYVSARFVSQDGKVTYLWFSGIDANGELINAPKGTMLERWMARLQADDSMLKQSLTNASVGMIQLVAEVDGFLPADSEKALEELHKRSRSELKKILNPK